MIKIGNKIFYIDFNAIRGIVNIDNSGEKHIETESTTIFNESMVAINTTTTTKEYPKQDEIDVIKWDLIKVMIDVVINVSNDDTDETLGADKMLKEQPIPFKVAFNTLKFYGIVKEL
jgi:hypothetical protein